MFALPYADTTVAGIVSFYSIVHTPNQELVRPFHEFYRVLRAGGLVAVAFHVGEGCTHVDELWGCATSLDFWFHRPEAVIATLEASGFVIEARLDRAPYPDVEHPSHRSCVLARRR